MLRAALAPALALILAMPLLLAPAQAAEPLTRGEVETIVREYLLANPEILEEAFAALQEKRLQEAEAARSEALTELRETLERSPHGAVLGNPEGDVTLVEFFDYNCGFCRRALEDMNRLIADDPNLRVVLKEFPVLGQPSMEAAGVSIAVLEAAPDRYAPFHERLLQHEGRIDGDTALTLAGEMGLPVDDLRDAMRGEGVRAAIEESYRLAQALQIEGTPSYVVGEAVEQGAVGYEQLKARINVARCGETTC